LKKIHYFFKIQLSNSNAECRFWSGTTMSKTTRDSITEYWIVHYFKKRMLLEMKFWVSFVYKTLIFIGWHGREKGCGTTIETTSHFWIINYLLTKKNEKQWNSVINGFYLIYYEFEAKTTVLVVNDLGGRSSRSLTSARVTD